MVVGVVTSVLLLVACSEDSSSDADTGPTHSLEPTDQMQELAIQECLDDPTKDQGVVRAVDPSSDDDEVFSEVVIDCDTVR